MEGKESARHVLLGMTPAELKALAVEAGLPAFAAKQLAQWMYKHGAGSFGEMTNLSKKARQWLSEHCSLGRSAPVGVQRSKDGTAKYLYATVDGSYVETVFIPSGERATLCVSSQVGCKMACRFCMTGRQGFDAQLSAADILNQIFSLPERDRLTNIVFMGQGEPMDNTGAVLRAVEVLTSEWGCAWSPGRITVSSVGLERGLVRLIEETAVHVAVSLHNPIASERALLMPAERAFGIERVVALLEQYEFCRRLRRGEERTGSHQRRLSFEYIVFAGVNDTRRHADALINLLRRLDCRINLIRFHPIPDSTLRGADDETMTRLRDYLTQHGLFTTIRASRGQDIMAACGLLSTARQQAEMPRQAKDTAL